MADGIVAVNIDGKDIKVRPGKNILEAIQENEGRLPTLCHDPRLKPFGACRLCLVEVEGFRRPVPACATKINQGMVIKTKTEQLAIAKPPAKEPARRE